MITVLVTRYMSYASTSRSEAMQMMGSVNSGTTAT